MPARLCRLGRVTLNSFVRAPTHIPKRRGNPCGRPPSGPTQDLTPSPAVAARGPSHFQDPATWNVKRGTWNVELVLYNQFMAVLSQEDRSFWEDQGYVIVPDAVPPENLKALAEVIWDFQGMDPENPESWYREPAFIEMAELNRSGMVELYHHQALWDNRQHPKVHEVFSEIWGTEKLWVTIDRANMNLPLRPGWEFSGFIHWDIDTSQRPLPFEVQGLLALQDTPENGGGFQCVPGFPGRFEEWLRTQPSDRDPMRPDLTGLEVKQIRMRAGDLLIWNSLLPHGASPNRSELPRLAQYISMFPVPPDSEGLRQERIRSWRERRLREGYAFPGDPGKREQTFGTTAELTRLGRKLLGLDLWESIED